MSRPDPERNLLGRFLRNSSATTAAEFALVVPVFIFLTFGTINVGIALSAITQMHFAAERAARCLAVDVAGTCTAGNIDSYAKGFYKGPSMSGLTFTPSTPTCGKQVVATGTYQFFTGFKSSTLNLSASACYPLI